MARKDVERLIGRAVLDAKFRESLFADPENTIREAGLDLSKKEIARLKEIDAGKAKAAVDELAALTEPWK